MSFWNTSDNEQIQGNGEFETGGGDIEPIPANTSVLAAPDEAGWAEYQGDYYINIRWSVLSPPEYANRKIFQKIRVEDSDPKKADKAKRMLAAIDANAGGKLLASGEKPTDQALTACLVNKPMVLKLQVWEIEANDGSGMKRGNWVCAVSPRSHGTATPKPAASVTTTDDDIPF